jgi:hypothetical protein
MNVKDAVKLAMEYVADLFEDEKIENLGLEEVEYDDDNHYWQVTIGFSRPWDYSRNAFAALASAGGNTPRRTYKLITINAQTKEVLSIKNRNTSAAA